MSTIIGIGVDLTQHNPLVSVAVCPDDLDRGADNAAAVARNWPPKIEIKGGFGAQLPVALLPVMSGEPLLVGDAAARHRRSAGFSWPPEAQVPFAGDPACGVGRVPLAAAWAALLPRGANDESMTSREDYEFKWRPDGREFSVRGSEMLARSIGAILTAAKVPFDSCRTAIVIPDALDEAGQQTLLDSLAEIGLPPDRLHLLPRPLAVALSWCHNADPRVFRIAASDEDDGTPVGRLRVLTMALDSWEVLSLEVRVRRYMNRAWLVPMRDRAQLAGSLPEIPVTGLLVALAIAYEETNTEPFGWWKRLFSAEWISNRLCAAHDMSPSELRILRQLHSEGLPEGLKNELEQLSSIEPLWSRLAHFEFPSRISIATRWSQQEQSAGTAKLACWDSCSMSLS